MIEENIRPRPILCNVDDKTCNCTEWDEKEHHYKTFNLSGCKKEEKKLKKENPNLP